VIHLALIGCGGWGWNYIPAASQSKNCEVTHVAGASVQRPLPGEDRKLKQIASRDWRTLLAAPVDAFIVATPPDSHEEICTTLLAAGRAVMVEKPLALTVRAANAIVEASTKSGAVLLVNHQHLFAPAYETLRDMVHGGPLWAVRSEAGGSGPHRAYSALWDYGPHDVAMSLGLARGPVSVRDAKKHGNTFVVDLSLGTSIAHVTVSTSMRQRRRSFWAAGPLLVARYDALAENQLTNHGAPVAVDPERPLQRAVRLFAEAVKTGKTDWRFGHFGAEVVRLLEDADRKIQEAP